MTDIDKQLKKYEYIITTVIRKHFFYIHRPLEYKDLHSAGMLAMWKAIPKFIDNGKAKIETFLYTVVHNALFSYVKYHKNKIDFVYTDDENIDGTNLTKTFYNCNDEVLLISNLNLSIQKLNDIHSVVINHQLNGYSYKAISELEGIPEGTVKSRRYRAINKLKEML